MAGTSGRAKRKAADTGNQAQKNKKMKSRPEDLSAFKDVPMDLLPNIFQHLSPNDLVNLCDASFMFWKALCCSSQASIWRNSRENENVFEIPDGMNEYRWAKLVFGSRCMECGADGVEYADFHLRRRICNKCRKEKCIEPRRQASTEFMEDACACSPVTYISPSGSKAKDNEVYWKQDVEEQQQKLLALQKNVDLNLPGATRALSMYKISRRKLIRAINSEVEDFAGYQDAWHAKLQEAIEEVYENRYDEISRRFVELGYSPRDLPRDMRYHKLVRLKANLTDRAWEAIREALEEDIKTRRDENKEADRHSLLVARVETLNSVYAAHKLKNLAPDLWKASPQLPLVALLPPFKALLTCDASRTVSKTDFESLAPHVNELLDTAYDELRISLCDHPVTAKDPVLAEMLSDGARASQLASVLLRCTRCQSLLYGFQDIHTHQCKINHPHSVVESAWLDLANFSPLCVPEEGGAQAACIVIKALGLDPKTATVAQVDELMNNKRLRCGSMKELPYRHVPVLRGFTWRGLIRHILENHETAEKRATLKDPQFIPEGCLPEILKDEMRMYDDRGQYSCAHCAEHLGLRDPWNRQRCFVEEHTKRSHGIPLPKKGVDFINITINHGLYFQYNRHGTEYYTRA